MIADLEEITSAWGPDGDARAALDGMSASGQLAVMLNGMGSLSFGQLAGERMQLGLMLHDPEEEHDCFSHNTHNSHYDDARGINNIYHGRYRRIDGSVVEGTSLASLAATAAPDVDAEMRAALDATAAAMQRLKDTADSGAMAYDQMLGESNPEGNALVSDAVQALSPRPASSNGRRSRWWRRFCGTAAKPSARAMRSVRCPGRTGTPCLLS